MAIKSGMVRSGKDRAFNSIDQETAAPPRIQDHIDYGYVTGITEEKSQLQVSLYCDPDGVILGKRYWPMIKPIQEIVSKYGKLRKGMIVRVHWRGRDTAFTAWVEVVGDEKHNLMEQNRCSNEMETFPHMMLSGGMH